MRRIVKNSPQSAAVQAEKFSTCAVGSTHGASNPSPKTRKPVLRTLLSTIVDCLLVFGDGLLE